MFDKFETQFNGVFSEITVDQVGKRIKNVALVGMISRNKRRYLPEALKAGVSKYEGAKVYIDHPGAKDTQNGFRSMRDLAGRVENARFDGNKIRGDIKLLDNEGGRLAHQIATEMPDIAGMSHNAYGKYKRENGTEVVESIEKVVSVDVVTEPATNNGFYEGAGNPSYDELFIEKKIAESGLPYEAKTEVFKRTLITAYESGGESAVNAEIAKRFELVEGVSKYGSESPKAAKGIDVREAAQLLTRKSAFEEDFNKTVENSDKWPDFEEETETENLANDLKFSKPGYDEG